jgi:hypothetical protein
VSESAAVTFVRGEPGGHDRLVIVRHDGHAVSLPLADYGSRPPHDLVHYAVESVFGIEWGFYGLVVAGAQLQAVAAAGARNPKAIGRTGDPLLAAHLDELMRAEHLVNALGDVEGDDADTARALVAELNARWQATPPGGRLHLLWPAG